VTREEAEKWKRGRVTEMDEVLRSGSDERGLYGSGREHADGMKKDRKKTAM